MSDKAISSTTQEFLDVYDIVNDMVLLKDGSAAIILQVGTMNFSLLAEQEQDAVIFTYGSVLNSLNYPIQINIQSQTKDATKYLRLLDEQVTKASSDRKAALIKQYRAFVEGLIKERNVLQKRFYIIAPAGPSEMGLITPSSVLPGQGAFNIESVEKSILLEKATNILEPRVDHLTSQFNRLGLFARQLTTQEIIQNFYINYNPEAAEGQEISSSENYTTPLVRASFGGKFMQLNNIMQNQAAAQGQVMPTQSSAPVAPQPQMPPAQNQIQPTPAQETPVTPTTPVASEMMPAQELPPQQNQVFPPAKPVAEIVPTSEAASQISETPKSVEPTPAPDNLSPEYSAPTSEVSVDPAPDPSVSEPDEALAANPSPAVNLELNLDPNLLSGQAPEAPTTSSADQFMSVPAPQSSEEIPVIETAPIVEETALMPEEPKQDAATNTVAAPAPTPALTSTPVSPPAVEAPDFAEEITPLQIQDDAKNV